MGSSISSPIVPWTKVYQAAGKPEGADKVVKDLVAKAWPQFATILEAGARYLGLGPSQISPFLSYDRPASPGYNEATYAASLQKQYGQTLSGDVEIDYGDLLKENAKAALRDVGKQAIVDLATGVGIPSGVAQVGISLLEDPKALLTPEGRVNAGFAIASAIPVVQVAVAPVMVIKTAVEYHKAKSEMEKEMERAKNFQKMIESYIAVVVAEAKGLTQSLASRGVSIGPGSGDWSAQLRNHYEKLVIVLKEDENLKLAEEKREWYAQKGEDVVVQWEARKAFTPVELGLGRSDTLRLLLQLARDMRKVRLFIDGKIPVQGTTAKGADEVKSETVRMTEELVAANPTMPYQEAANVAAKAVRSTQVPITPEKAAQVAQSVQPVVEAEAKKQTVIKAGMLVVGVIGLIFKLKG